MDWPSGDPPLFWATAVQPRTNASGATNGRRIRSSTPLFGRDMDVGQATGSIQIPNGFGDTGCVQFADGGDVSRAGVHADHARILPDLVARGILRWPAT